MFYIAHRNARLRTSALAGSCLLASAALPACSAGGGSGSNDNPLQGAGGGFGYAGAAGGQQYVPGVSGAPSYVPPPGAGGNWTPPVQGNGGSGTAGFPPVGTAGAPPVTGAGGNQNVPPGPTGLVPCAVADALSRNCAECHGTPPGPGPMSLSTVEDFHKNSTMNGELIRSLVQKRINDAGNPMPPSNAEPMSPADKAALEAWLAGGAMPVEGDACQVTAPEVDDPMEDPTGGWENATCYELLNHGRPTPGDTTPYNVPTGEHYVEFHFDPPYKEPSVMVGWRTIYDKKELLHHWLFYNAGLGAQANGAIVQGIGAHIGLAVELMGGWAVGGNEMDVPAGVAGKLPEPNGKMFIEWHYWNSTGRTVQDRSGIEICVVPKSAVDPSKISSVTWIGSENLVMPAGQTTTVRASCTPSFNNVPQGEPIRIFGFNPHMHTIGSHMRTWILRANGTAEKVFDKPFRFDNQLNYPLDEHIEVHRGDKVINDCTFTNNTSRMVGFGPSSDAEMCYQFSFSYPMGGLPNSVFSLTGATNTCWDFLPAACPGCVP